MANAGNVKCVVWVVTMFLVLGAGTAAAAGAPAIEWQNVLGGSSIEDSRSIQQTSDGGYILAGSTLSGGTGDVGAGKGMTDVWVVKLKPSGDLDWQNVLGGSNDDYAESIRQTSDGGYILAGSTKSRNSGDVGANHGMSDAWVVRLTTSGDLDWQTVLGGSNDEFAKSIQQTADGGYIVAGTTASSGSGDVGAGHGMADVWVVRLKPSGDLDWQTVLGGSNNDYAESIQQTGDGGYIIAGFTSSGNSGDVGLNHGMSDAWIVRLKPTGDLDWQKVLGGTDDDAAFSIRQTGDGGYIFTGETFSGISGDITVPNQGGQDVWVVRLDSAGAIVWQDLLGGWGFESAKSIRQTGDGGYILTGYTNSDSSGDVGANHGSNDVWTVKLDPDGSLAWQKVLGGSGNDVGQDIRQTTGGGYVMTGYTMSNNNGDVGANNGWVDVWVVKLKGPAVLSLPGYTALPTDPDGDGIYEDLNGNGRMDFADVVLYFNQMDWMEDNEPIAAFDLNGNGRIDFADIVALFNEI